MAGRALASLVVLAIAATGCGDDDDDDDEGSRVADVLSAAIRDVVADQPTPIEDDKPVVFVVGVGEDGVSAADQAKVATTLRDDIDVHFADAREEPIDSDAEGAPVRDEGVLLLVSDIPEAQSGGPVEVSIEIYRSETDWSKAVFTLAEAGDTWRVTATSLVPLDSP